MPAFTAESSLTSVQTLSDAQLELKTQLSGTGIQGISDWKTGTAMQDLIQLLATFYVYSQQRVNAVTLAACEPTASGSFP